MYTFIANSEYPDQSKRLRGLFSKVLTQSRKDMTKGANTEISYAHEQTVGILIKNAV